MCGRVRLSSDISEIKLVFSIPPHRPTPNIAPSWNVAPTDPLPIVRYDAKAGERSLDVMRWGLVPFWAKDIKVGFSNINAKAEGIEGKPAFREAFQRRRCLVPVDNSTSGRRQRRANSPTQLRLPTGAGWPWQAFGRLGAHKWARGCAASRSSRRRQTSCARSFTTECRCSSGVRCGRSGWGSVPPESPARALSG
jgi:hypothetical protein